MASNQEEIQTRNIKAHEFDDWAKELMETKPIINQWQLEQVGTKNEGPYRDGYQNMIVEECGEQLVNCAEYGLVSKDYYINKFYDGLVNQDQTYLPLILERKLFPFAWLRESVVKKLVRADQLLRQHGLFLVVNSGWRHPDTQKQAIDKAATTMGTKDTERLFAKVISPHSTGGAVDVELWSLQDKVLGKSLSFSFAGDEYGFYNYETSNNLNENELIKRRVRRILYHVLTREGLTIHPGEFWHFGDGDPLSAYLSQNKFAKFGLIEPPKDYLLTHFI